MALRPTVIPPHHMRCLLGALFSLVVADGLMTVFLVRLGLAWEWNPLLRMVVVQDSFLLIKVAGALTGAVALWQAYRNHPAIASACSVSLVAAYTTIVYWNVLVYLVSRL